MVVLHIDKHCTHNYLYVRFYICAFKMIMNTTFKLTTTSLLLLLIFNSCNDSLKSPQIAPYSHALNSKKDSDMQKDVYNHPRMFPAKQSKIDGPYGQHK